MPDNRVHQIKVDPKGTPVEMEMFIGEEQVGAFEVSLYDENGHSLGLIMKDTNVPTNPPPFPVSSDAITLIGQHIGWNIVVAPVGDRQDQQYYTRTTFRQNGDVIPGGDVERSGELTEEHSLFGFARFVSS